MEIARIGQSDLQERKVIDDRRGYGRDQQEDRGSKEEEGANVVKTHEKRHDDDLLKWFGRVWLAIGLFTAEKWWSCRCGRERW